jgi:hypothetical protein
MDERGEVIFNIDPDASKNIKPGAFYNFAVLQNAFNKNKPSEYKKLTENGKVNIEYGAHDLVITKPDEQESLYDVLRARVELTDDDSSGVISGAITKFRLEDIK